MNALTDQFSAVSAVELSQVEGGLYIYPWAYAYYLTLGSLEAVAETAASLFLKDPKADPWR